MKHLSLLKDNDRVKDTCKRPDNAEFLKKWTLIFIPILFHGQGIVDYFFYKV